MFFFFYFSAAELSSRTLFSPERAEQFISSGQPSKRYERRQSHVIREKRKQESKEAKPETVDKSPEAQQSTSTADPATVAGAAGTTPSLKSTSPTKSEDAMSTKKKVEEPIIDLMLDLSSPPSSLQDPLLLLNSSPNKLSAADTASMPAPRPTSVSRFSSTMMEAETRLDDLIKSLQKGSSDLMKGDDLQKLPMTSFKHQLHNDIAADVIKEATLNNRAGASLTAKQNLLPSQDYVKNNILKAEKLVADNEKFFANDLKGSIHSPNLNLSGESPPAKSSATFVSVGGDKLTLALNSTSGSNNSNNLSPSTPKLINVESASKIPRPKAPTPPPRTTSDPSYAADVSSLLGIGNSSCSGGAATDSGISLSTTTPDIPISVTHFSTATNGFGVEKETLFTDGSEEPTAFDAASIVRKHLTNPFLTPTTTEDQLTPSDQLVNPFTGKFNTIGRSNPFSSPNRSRNPFLDTTTGEDGSAAVNGISGVEPNRSPDASIDPTPTLMPTMLESSDDANLSKPTLKIETSFASSQPVTRSLSSVGSSSKASFASKLPVPTASATTSQQKMNGSMDSARQQKLNSSKSALENISPWLVTSDTVTPAPSSKRSSSTTMSKIPQLKTVITTEL